LFCFIFLSKNETVKSPEVVVKSPKGKEKGHTPHTSVTSTMTDVVREDHIDFESAAAASSGAALVLDTKPKI
jgi:hypothetical protein